MKLEWIGHSCFRMTAEDGTIAITDPYDANTGYDMVPLKADLITMSHEHGDHNCEQMITGSPKIVHGLQDAQAGSIRTHAVGSYHDDVQGAKRGPNAVRIFEIDGLKIVHMGDQGCMPSADVLTAIRSADVMMIPCGGFFTVDAAGAKAIVDAAKPRCVVPMHIKGKRGGYDVLSGVRPFLSLMGAEGTQAVREAEMKKGAVPEGVLLMAPLAGEL